MVKPLPLLHITFFVGALLYLVSSGLILLLPSLKMLIDGFRTQSWPAVASRINSTGIVLEHLPSGSRYCVRLTYHYRVDDVGFVGGPDLRGKIAQKVAASCAVRALHRTLYHHDISISLIPG